MSDNIHSEQFNKIKNYKASQEDIRCLKGDMRKFLPLLQHLIQAYNITTPEDLKKAAYTFVLRIFETSSQNKYIDSNLYELHATEDILKNPSIIDELYPEIKDEPTVNTVYNANHNRSRRILLINTINQLAELEAFAKDNNITANTRIENTLIRAENAKEVKNALRLTINILKENNIRNKILLLLEEQKKFSEDYIRENQTLSLENLYSFFHAFGFDKSYISKYTYTKENFGFPELEYTHEDFKKSFSSDFLKTLPLRDVCFLNAFWSNRFAKESSRLTSTFITINSLDLWQDILDGKTDFSYSEETLIAGIRKSKYLGKLIGKTCDIHEKTISSLEFKGKNPDENVESDYTDYYLRVNNSINEDYSTFFEQFSLKNNVFLDDVTFALPFISLEKFAYRKKDTSIEPLIKNMLDNNYCKNWGLIRNELQNGHYVDTLSTTNPLLLLAFDFEGLNMPFRFHVKRRTLLYLAKLSNSDALIPEYQGAEDFVRFYKDGTRENIPSNIIMPILKDHKKAIIDNSKIDGPRKNMWEHFYYLMNGNFPKHLTTPIKKGNKKIVYSRKPIHYTNLESGARFIKEGKNYKEVDNNGR